MKDTKSISVISSLMEDGRTLVANQINYGLMDRFSTVADLDKIKSQSELDAKRFRRILRIKKH